MNNDIILMGNDEPNFLMNVRGLKMSASLV